jgi:hypothetical protein
MKMGNRPYEKLKTVINSMEVLCPSGKSDGGKECELEDTPDPASNKRLRVDEDTTEEAWSSF